MKLVFTEASLWKEVLLGASKLVNEITLIAGSDGVKMRALDPSHVVLVDVFFPRESLEEYESNNESFGLELDSFAEIIRRARKDDALSLELVGDKLKVSFKGKFLREFYEPTGEPSFKDLPDPKIDLKAEVRILPKVLAEAVEDVEMMSDNLTFEVTTGEFKIFSESEIGSASVEFQNGDEGIISIQSDGTQKGTYGIDFFSDLLSTIRSAEVAILSLSTDMPSKLVLELPAGARLVTFVAPRTA
jgi:proliferating cell nuclear antigen